MVSSSNLNNISAKICVISGTLAFSTESSFEQGDGMPVSQVNSLVLQGIYEINNLFFRAYDATDVVFTVMIERS